MQATRAMRFRFNLPQHDTIAENGRDGTSNGLRDIVGWNSLISPSNRDQINISFQSPMHRDGIPVEPRHLADGR